MQAHAVDDAGVRLGVVHDDIVAVHQRVDDAHHALVAEVEQQRVGLVHEVGQLVFQLLVQGGVAAHDARAHRVGHAVLGGAFGVGLAHFGVVGQAEVVVQAPGEHFFAAEHHAGLDFAFQLGKGEVAVGVVRVRARAGRGWPKSGRKYPLRNGV